MVVCSIPVLLNLWNKLVQSSNYKVLNEALMYVNRQDIIIMYIATCGDS